MISRFLVWLIGDIQLVANTFGKWIRPVHVDGVLYICIAVFGFLQTYFGSDDTYKYINPFVVFWILAVVGTLGAAAGALKMFRSNTYNEHLQEKKEEQGQSTTVTTVETKTP